MGLARAAVVERPLAEQRDEVAGASCPDHLGAEGLVGVARDQRLGLAERRDDRSSVYTTGGEALELQTEVTAERVAERFGKSTA
jgi:hypothetical protein